MTDSQQHAMEIVDYLKANKMSSWMSAYTTIVVGRSLSPSVNRVLKSWGVLTQSPRNRDGNYTVNYDATVFGN